MALIRLGPLAQGWKYRADPTQIPPGGAFEMRNCTITDRDGIAPRPGTQLFGAENVAGNPVVTTWTHKTRAGLDIPLRTSTSFLEYYNTVVPIWDTLKTGFTSALEFGAADHNVNTDNTDYTYFCNGVDPYQRWDGYHSKITSALVGGETSIPVVTTLKASVFDSKTATASTNTTITVAGTPWGTNLWNTFYVRITTGAFTGRISLISATTTNTITFAAIAGLAGTVTTFEIRQIATTTTGTLIYGGTNVAYTAIPTDASFTVASANAAAINTAIARVPVEFVVNSTSRVPRGNRLLVQHTRLFLANVPGNESTLYHSKINDASDFRFSSPRLATDGGTIDTPEGGGSIQDIVNQEDTIYILKRGIAKTLTFTQDGNDLPVITPLIESDEVSVAGRAFKVANDTYFATEKNAITSIGRLPYIDQNPRAFDISYDVKTGVSQMDFSTARGATFKDKTVIATRETTSSTNNDIVIAYNHQRQAWEGIWDLDAADFFRRSGRLYFGSSASKEAYLMFEGIDKDKAGTHYSVNSFWKSGFHNFTKEGTGLQRVSRVHVSGYIAGNTTLAFQVAYDFGNTSAAYTWNFEGTDTDFIYGDLQYNYLGQFPLGAVPLGSISESVSDNKRKFYVVFNIPETPHHWFQLGWGSNGIGQDWEIVDVWLDVEQIDDVDGTKIFDTELGA